MTVQKLYFQFFFVFHKFFLFFQIFWDFGIVSDVLASALPDPTVDSTMVMVCGTDQFVATWSGEITRVRDPETGKKSKVQGPLLGILKRQGFTEAQVYKF